MLNNSSLSSRPRESTSIVRNWFALVASPIVICSSVTVLFYSFETDSNYDQGVIHLQHYLGLQMN